MGTQPGIVTIGVVTPTLNAERYLEDTLRSIWSQQSDAIDVDHVIVDGGSTDRTIQIASRYPSRVIEGSDGGMYEAVNRGLDVVGGEIVGYINGDDEIAPNGFAAVVEAFGRRPSAEWVCGRVEYIDGSGARPRPDEAGPADRSFLRRAGVVLHPATDRVVPAVVLRARTTVRYRRTGTAPTTNCTCGRCVCTIR